MWRLEGSEDELVAVVEADDWCELLEEAVQAFANAVTGDRVPDTEMRRMRKIELDHDESRAPDAAWMQWWRGLQELWSREALLPVSAGLHRTSTYTHTRAVTRCVPQDAVADAARFTLERHPEPIVACGPEEDGWIGRVILRTSGTA